MYIDVKRRPAWLLALLVLIAALLLCALALRASRGGEVREESAQAIREAVRRSALQCYAVEGVYPPNLKYLTEHYGLVVNEEDFYISYDAFASNQPPDIRVRPRQHG